MKFKNLNTQTGRTSFITKFIMSCMLLLTLSVGVFAQAQVTMNFVWVGSTTNTADFDVYLRNSGAGTMTFNGIILRGNHAASLLQGGVDTISWNSVAGSAPTSVASGNSWNNWPNLATNLPYTATSRLMNYSSASAFFTSATAPTIPTTAGGIKVGRFRMTVTGGTWVSNSQFSFVWATGAAVIVYMNGATTTTGLATAGGNKIVTVSASQPLNAPSGPAGVMTGSATVCEGSSSNISVAVTGGTSPYTLVYGDGTNSYTVNSYTTGSAISVTPSATSTWETFGVNFENYTGTGQHIAFRVKGVGATNSMYIDDLSIDISPTCQIPTGLARTIISSTSIELDWNSADDANVLSWIVEYKPFLLKVAFP